MTYNRMLKYARTILALAKTIELIEKPAVKTAAKADKKKAAAKAGKKKAAAKSTLKKNSIKKNAKSSKPKAKSKAQTMKKRWVSSKGRDVTAYID